MNHKLMITKDHSAWETQELVCNGPTEMSPKNSKRLKQMQDLRFSKHCWWRIKSHWMLSCIFLYTGTVVSKHYSVFIFRVKRVFFWPRRLLDLEHTDTTVLSNVSNYLPADTA